MLSQAQIDLARKVRPFVVKGQYKKALGIVERALAKEPGDLFFKYQYAKLLGDWADEKPGAEKAKLKRRATKILEEILPQSGLFPVEVRFGMWLNYFYQSENWPAMYKFGQRFIKEDRDKGIYAQALGSVLRAEQLAANRRLASAKKWADLSVRAWRRYPLAKEKYYFAHYSFAKALALAGKFSEGRRRLAMAARRAERPITDWEFADVLAMRSRE